MSQEEDKAAEMAQRKIEELERASTEEQRQIAQQLQRELVERFRDLVEKKDVAPHTTVVALIAAGVTIASGYLTRPELSELLAGVAESYSMIDIDPRNIN